MAQVNFQYITLIKCQEEEKISNICKNFILKSHLNENAVKFYYPGSGSYEFDQNLTFTEMANEIDQKRKKMTFIVMENLNYKNDINKKNNSNINNNVIIDNKKENSNMSNNNIQNNNEINDILNNKIKKIICPSCNEEIRIKLEQYLTNLQCVNCRKSYSNIPLKVLINNQIIQNGSQEVGEKKINKKKYTYICSKHKEPIEYACKTCNKFLCSSCEDHHEKIQIIEKKEAEDKLKEMKSRISKFNKQIERMSQILNQVKEIINSYYKLNEDIINNYELSENLNIETIFNLNELTKNNEIIKDIDEVNNAFRINDIFNKITKIYRKNSNEIRLKVKVEKNEINKDIYFLGKVNEEVYTIVNLTELKEENTDIYIGDKKYSYQKKYFKPEKEGIYEIILKFKILLKDISYMFIECNNIINVDLSTLNTRLTNNLEGLFFECSTLKDIDFSYFNIPNVTNMSEMFRSCISLKEVDLSHLITNNLENMSCMFFNCINLISLDLSSFNTEKVEDMSKMFYQCYKLPYLNLSSFNTKNVKTMEEMFYECNQLKSLDLTSFDTSNVKEMESMFNSCINLVSINLSSFNTQNVLNFKYMFFHCLNLPFLDISNFDMNNVEAIDDMFRNCAKLKEIKINKNSEDIIRENGNIKFGLTKLIIV